MPGSHTHRAARCSSLRRGPTRDHTCRSCRSHSPLCLTQIVAPILTHTELAHAVPSPSQPRAWHCPNACGSPSLLPNSPKSQSHASHWALPSPSACGAWLAQGPLLVTGGHVMSTGGHASAPGDTSILSIASWGGLAPWAPKHLAYAAAVRPLH